MQDMLAAEAQRVSAVFPSMKVCVVRPSNFQACMMASQDQGDPQDGTCCRNRDLVNSVVPAWLHRAAEGQR